LVSKQKIAGILIQNNLQGNYITHSVIGLGFNVNQLEFMEYSPKATSLRLQLDKEYEVLQIQEQFLSFLSERLKRLKVGENQDNEYLNSLFLKDKPAAFESNDKQFMGIIKGVSESGKLLIKLEDDSIAAFENQQVKYLF
jgi:BirA family biotin operon repressor/biotin-[acetyl-CoA-carboxylase] ligase